MSEITTASPSLNESKTLAYAAGIMMFICAPIGVIIAYMDRPKASQMIASHYNYTIGTFWKALLLAVLNVLLSFVLIGFLTMIASGIWYMVRVVKGLVYLYRGEPISKPSTWWI